MTTPSEQHPSEAGFFRAIRNWGLTRGDNGFLGGVVDGLAQRVGMATVPARILVVIAAILLNGLVVLAYTAAWALIPDRKGNIIIQNFGRGIPNVGALIGIAILTLVGMGNLDHSGPFNGIHFSPTDPTPWGVISLVFGILVPLAFVGGVVWFIIVMVRRSQNPTGGQPAAVPPTQAATPPSPAADAPAAADASATPTQEPASQPTAATPVYAAVPQATASAAVPPPQPHASPIPPAPPLPPRVPGPGRGFYLAALAWVVLSGAVVGILDRQDQLAVHPAAAWFVVMVTGLGVILMGVSLAGRKLGFLGFMVIVLALPLPLVAAGADDLRDAYANDGSLLHIDMDGVSHDVTTYDATADFVKEYTEVVINGECRDSVSIPPSPDSTARISFDTLDADTSVDVVSKVTYVTIPAGTDLRVEGEGDAQAHVIWPDRHITCDFWNAGGEHLTLANNVGPALTLVVYDDAYVNTIVITETAS